MDKFELLEQLLAYLEAETHARNFGPVIPPNLRERREKAEKMKGDLQTALSALNTEDKQRITTLIRGLRHPDVRPAIEMLTA